MVMRALQATIEVLAHLIFTPIQRDWHCDPHVTDEKTETQGC